MPSPEQPSQRHFLGDVQRCLPEAQYTAFKSNVCFLPDSRTTLKLAITKASRQRFSETRKSILEYEPRFYALVHGVVCLIFFRRLLGIIQGYLAMAIPVSQSNTPGSSSQYMSDRTIVRFCKWIFASMLRNPHCATRLFLVLMSIFGMSFARCSTSDSDLTAGIPTGPEV